MNATKRLKSKDDSGYFIKLVYDVGKHQSIQDIKTAGMKKLLCPPPKNIRRLVPRRDNI